MLGSQGEEALCILLGPCEAYVFLMPSPTAESSPCSASPALDGPIWSWFRDEQNLCLTSNAKELVASFLKRGIDLQCSLAEPRIAHWLLDPDDKENMNIATLAALCQITLESKSSILAGATAGLSPVLKARLLQTWPEVFVTLPLVAELLRRLGEIMQASVEEKGCACCVLW